MFLTIQETSRDRNGHYIKYIKRKTEQSCDALIKSFANLFAFDKDVARARIHV